MQVGAFAFRREYRGGLKAVIFDWAGTTMDFGCIAPAEAFVEVFRRYGVDVTQAEARVPMGAHKRVHIHKLSQIPRIAARWLEVHGAPFDEAALDRMFADFVPLQLEILPKYSDLLPGTLEVVGLCRRRGLKIGSTTGYTAGMNALLLAEAAARGYAPDTMVCADDVPEGRPAPWMCLENAKRLGVYPMTAIVKVGDTQGDVLEGLDAGMWTIGVAITGNEVGLTKAEWEALGADERERRRAYAYGRLHSVGAHYVIDGIWDVPPLLDEIDRRIARGEKP